MNYTVSATINSTSDGEGRNFEQLFTHGCSACLSRSIVEFAKKHNLDGRDVRVTCQITMDQNELSCGFKVDLNELAGSANKVMLYSNSTRDSAPITLTVV